jgi:hypothetical protein
LNWLIESMRLKDHGWLCTAVVVWNIVLRAAARTSSLCAACRDLADGPSDQAVMNALADGLPKTLRVLEDRLNGALVDRLPRRLQRRSWQVAIDWHLTPYYGEPKRSRNELFYGKPRQGTKKFHAYATACIVSYGVRYTLAVTWVRRHETTVVALGRLLARIRGKGLKIRRLLLDRAFFNVPVTHLLQAENIPFLMPVMFRGRTIKNPKKKRKPTGLHWIKRQTAGWYPHTLSNKTQTVSLSVCVAYRTHKNRKDGKRKQQKLLFAAWRVRGSPREIRNTYRKRFGIETSYRQWRQARIFTCTRNPHLRLVFVVIGLLLRNVWVWIHDTLLAEGWGETMTLHLEQLRFRRMLDWIALEIVAQLHDGTPPYVELRK